MISGNIYQEVEKKEIPQDLVDVASTISRRIPGHATHSFLPLSTSSSPLLSAMLFSPSPSSFLHVPCGESSPAPKLPPLPAAPPAASLDEEDIDDVVLGVTSALLPLLGDSQYVSLTHYGMPYSISY